jgi:hypothetical protein
MAWYLAEFHENLPIASKVIKVDTQTDKTGDLISLLSFFESRIEMKRVKDVQQ